MPRWAIFTCMMCCFILSSCQGTAQMAVVLPNASATPTALPLRLQSWLTMPDGHTDLAEQPVRAFSQARGNQWPLITVNDTQTYQQVIGFGASLTETAAYLINRLPESAMLMQTLFGPAGLHISLLRQPLGCSDFCTTFYSYDDTGTPACPAARDPQLACFSLGADQQEVLPLLAEARQLNPSLTVMGSSWSAPGWMKTTGSLLGGTLLPADAAIYARYLVKTLQTYARAGIPLSILTIQNEPGVTLHYPGMDFPAQQEAAFYQHFLAPALAASGLAPTILMYDSFYLPDAYHVFAQAFAGLPVGAAFHCYAGIPAPGQITVDFYETECADSLGGYAPSASDPLHPIDAVIDWMNAGAKSFLFWNIAADQALGPQPQGSSVCHCIPLLTLPTNAAGQPTGQIIRNTDFALLGHASKFIQPGAWHIGLGLPADCPLNAVAFVNPDGSHVLLAHNLANHPTSFLLEWHGQQVSDTLPAGAVATLIW
jgi:glucosylceramidase